MRSRLLALCLGAVAVLAGASSATGAPTELIFSEYIEGSSNNKALEIYNGTGAPIDLAANNYKVQMFFNGGAAAGLTINLTGTVANGDVYVLAHSSAAAAILAQADQLNGSGWFNGDDAVALLKGASVVDSIGEVGLDPGTEWGSGLASTADNTLRRKLSVTAGDTAATNPFDPAAEWDGHPTDAFEGLGRHGSGGAAAVSVSCGAPLSVVQGLAATREITATDADGVVTSITLGAVTPAPAAGSIARTSFAPSEAVGGTATASVAVDAAVPPGTYAVSVTAVNADAPTPQSASCTLTVNVTPVRTIGEIQGAVSDNANGRTHASPFRNQIAVIRGVVYEKTLTRDTRTGNLLRGFFIQNTVSTDDDNPQTSDGIFVYMDRFTDLIGGYVPAVGDEVVISGTVQEDFNLTRLANARLVQHVASAMDVDAALAFVVANPPAVLGDADRYWERLEGMRVRVPSESVVTDGLDVFAGSLDSEMWLMRGDQPVAQRTDPYTARVFRDAHPLDNQPTPLFDDGNGFRIMVAALGRKGATNDWTTVLSPARTFDRTTNELVGGVYYAFSKYSIQTENAPTLQHGLDPALNAPPTAGNRRVEYSVGDYNVENLYDFRDDPFDGCDFVGNGGCTGVSPPFDYVPASAETYETRLALQARQIIEDLHAPDILLVQEAEDQDICTVAGSELSCGTTNNADGKPDTLQELALAIAAAGGPAYDAAFDRDGSDDRGIIAALMYRADRVQLLPVTADHPVLGSTPDFEYVKPGNAYNANIQNPKALNAPLPDPILAEPSNRRDGVEVYTRDPQVGYFRIWRNAIGSGAFTDVYAISNHFSSTPDNRVNQRREQARYLSLIVGALGQGARVVAGGDFNVYPRPDDPLIPPSDQLGPLYGSGLTNLWDILAEEAPAAAYSYVFVGMAQTLDGQFVSSNVLDSLVQTRVAHVNADFPADYDGDGTRGLSDHDPLSSRFAMPPTLAGLRALLAYYSGAARPQALKSLQDRLDRAERFAADGRLDPYRSQLEAFADQALDFAPQHLSQAAAESLAGEADLLRNS